MQFTKDKLKLIFSEKFKGLIWKILINEQRGLLAIENRDSELKQVCFSVLNLKNGEINFKEKAFEEPWTLNLVYTGEENLVLTDYEHSNSPESKGILSVNIRDGSLLWQKYNLSLNQIQDIGIQVYESRIYPRKYTWIDHVSSVTISDPGEIIPEKKSLLLPELQESPNLPEFFKHLKIAGDILILNYKGLNIISFHEQMDNYMTQRLIVYQDNNILLDDILIPGIQKLQPEAFFIQSNQLFYIRNKNEIVSYLV